MADTFATQEAAVRAALSADLVSVWGAKAVYHSEPETVIDAAALPVAVLDLGDPIPDDDYSSVRLDGIRLEYTITGHFAKPTSGTLHAAKMAKANALRAVLTAGQFYHGFNREWMSDTYSAQNTEDEATDNDFKISVKFAVIVLVEVG